MDLIVSAEGWASWNGKQYRCALGPSGARREKREGDGATPTGRFPFRRLLYRADRLQPPATHLPQQAIDPADGWCDDPASADYNRPVRLPHPARHEKMWLETPLYDLVVVIGHNDAPVVKGAGSAVFLHVAREDWGPTEGCVAFARDDLLAILAQVSATDAVEIRSL